MGVAEEGRTLAEQVVDVVVAVDVVEPGALAAGEEDPRRVEPDVRVDAAGDAARGARVKRREWALDATVTAGSTTLRVMVLSCVISSSVYMPPIRPMPLRCR